MNLAQFCASQSAFVEGEGAAFFVERGRVGGELEGNVGGRGETELLGCVIGGCACYTALIVGVEDGHVRGGVGCPVDGVEEGGIVCVEDGVVATFVMKVEGSEGFGMSEHCESFLLSGRL